jgi:hypothetical protein
MSSTVRLHPFEGDQLDSLRSYRVLDTEPDPAIDALTALAATACRTPVACGVPEVGWAV